MGPRQYYVAVGTQEAKLTTLVELLQALQADGSGVALAVACGSRDALDAVTAALAACGTFSLAVLHADLTMPEAERQVVQVKERLSAAQPRQQDDAAGAEAAPPAPREAAEAAAAGGGGAAAAAAAAAGEGGVPAGEEGLLGHHQAAEGADGGGGGGGEGGEGGEGDGGGGTTADAHAPRASLVLTATDAVLRGLPKDLLPIGLPLLIQYDIPQSKDVFTRRLSAVFGGSKDRRRGPGARPPVVIDFVVAGELPAFRARERFSTTPVLEMPVHVPDIL